MSNNLPPQSQDDLPGTVQDEGFRLKQSTIYAFLLPVSFVVGLLAGYLIWGRTTATVESPQTTQEIPTAVVQPTSEATDQADAPSDEEPMRFDIGVDDDPTLGPEDAPITIIEFSDFNCGYCRLFHTETFNVLLEAYPEQIRFVYRDFPVVGGFEAALAAQCAHEQGAFWAFHDLLFSGDLAHERSAYLSYAETAGVDTAAFEQCLDEERYADEINADAQEVINLGARGTPTFFVNGIPVVGALPLENFMAIIDSELAK
jgi:protein-disulfide isomerase